MLGAATETWLLWYGLMFMAVVMFKPEGIAGVWQSLFKSPDPAVAAHHDTRPET